MVYDWPSQLLNNISNNALRANNRKWLPQLCEKCSSLIPHVNTSRELLVQTRRSHNEQIVCNVKI